MSFILTDEFLRKANRWVIDLLMDAKFPSRDGIQSDWWKKALKPRPYVCNLVTQELDLVPDSALCC